VAQVAVCSQINTKHDFNDPYSSQNYSGDQIENEMGGECRQYEGQERCIRLLVGKLEGRRPFGRPRRRWEDNIKMDLQEGLCSKDLAVETKQIMQHVLKMQ